MDRSYTISGIVPTNIVVHYELVGHTRGYFCHCE
jgi:hypothetical protein